MKHKLDAKNVFSVWWEQIADEAAGEMPPPPLKEEKAPPLSQTGEGWTKDHVAINPTDRKFAHELIKITTHSYAKMRT